ncbi:nucleoside 2-deoxyribosyltransferase domain-containing protein [Eubacterium sp.]
MKKYNIYLAGAMQGISFDESNVWRKEITTILNSYRNEVKYDVNVINPNNYYNFKEVTYDTQREVMEFDLYKVRNADMIIVDFTNPKSLGTMAEIAIAYEHRIPVIGLNESGIELHSWQIEMCNKIFSDKNKLVNYVIDYYLN